MEEGGTEKEADRLHTERGGRGGGIDGLMYNQWLDHNSIVG